MNITIKNVKGVQVVQLKGEIDMGSVDLLNEGVEKLLAETISQGIIFDMNELIFVDSTGVGALLNICNQLSALSTPFYFVNLTSDVSEVFDILGLSMAIGEEHFNFHSTEEALSHLVMLNNEKN